MGANRSKSQHERLSDAPPPPPLLNQRPEDIGPVAPRLSPPGTAPAPSPGPPGPPKPPIPTAAPLQNGGPAPAAKPLPNGGPAPIAPPLPNGGPVPAVPPVPNGGPLPAPAPLKPPTAPAPLNPPTAPAPLGPPAAPPAPAPIAAALPHQSPPIPATPTPAPSPTPAGPQGGRVVPIGGVPVKLNPATVARLTAAAPPAPPRPAATRPPVLRERTLRVFLSSVLADTTAERDEIRTKVVPRLRSLCAERGLFLRVIDLRWGVADREAASGEVIRLSLREAQRGAYFVGILKGRYGWHVDLSAPEDDEGNALFRWNLQVAACEFPWACECSDLSVPEIEMRAWFHRHAQSARGRTLFFLAENPGPAEGPDAGRMASLRNEIQQAGLAAQPYRDPAQLALAVRDALVQSIERDYPLESEQPWLWREREAQTALADARVHTFVGDPQDAASLDQYASSDGPESYVLCGEPGAGKSSVLAYWSERWAGSHPDDITVAHFAPQGSCTLSSIARRLAEEVRERWPEVEELDWRGPDAEVAGRLKAWLAAGARFWPGRAVLALDGVDLIPGDAVVRALARAGPRLRLVLTCLPGSALLKAPHIAKRDLPKLDSARRHELALWVLQEHGANIGDARVERIVQAPHCSNAAYLRALLDEMAAVAVPEALDDVLSACLACKGPRDLYRHSLRRIAKRHWPTDGGESVVAEASAAMVCSRHGMAESELAAMLHVGESRGPRELAWQLAWHDLQPLLVEREGVFTFVHRCATEAAQLEFGLAKEVKGEAGPSLERVDARCKGVHERLGAFFAKQEPSRRRAEEAPWALAEAGNKQRLAELLCEPDVLRTLDESELAELWTRSGLAEEAPKRYADRLPANPGPSAANGDAEALPKPNPLLLEGVLKAGLTLDRIGHAAEGIPFLERALKMKEELQGPDHPDTAATRLQLARIQQAHGNYAAALPLLERTVWNKERSLGPNHPATGTALLELAGLHRARGDYPAALPLLERALGISEDAMGPEHPRTAAAMTWLGRLHLDREDPVMARPLLERALVLNEDALGPDHPATAATQHWLGRLKMEQGELAAARPLLERSLATRRATYGPRHADVMQSVTSLAELHAAAKEYEPAQALLKESLAGREAALGETHPDVAETLHAFGRLEAARERPDEARARFEVALSIRRKRLGEEHPLTQRTAAALGQLSPPGAGDAPKPVKGPCGICVCDFWKDKDKK